MPTNSQQTVQTRLRVSNKELQLIEVARDRTKQSRNKFVTKAAVDRARRVVREYSEQQEGVKEVLQ